MTISSGYFYFMQVLKSKKMIEIYSYSYYSYYSYSFKEYTWLNESLESKSYVKKVNNRP